eukprot:7848809-Alexandrium_andersonii.AAC.1
MRDCSRRSKLELRGPRNCLETDAQGTGGVSPATSGGTVWNMGRVYWETSAGLRCIATNA